ncbi:glycoside hydrolase superfamily [Mycena pura]|uniref:Glycoside hydrolase superfamily n=1 Tax=Mycena pura TaxID=153505 RepID=A0AAD6YD30_9AGAR|nr:glycoside hydrolase superfamily [Mycena pura]
MKLQLTAALLAAAVTLASGARVEKRQASTSIDTLLKGHGKAAPERAPHTSVAQNAAISAADFGGVTAGELGEGPPAWDTIEASRGGFNFAPFDLLVNWATTNGKKIRGHTFGTVQLRLPSWVTAINDAPTLTSVLQNHITQVMNIDDALQASSNVDAVDAVNEHIVDASPRAATSPDNPRSEITPRAKNTGVPPMGSDDITPLCGHHNADIASPRLYVYHRLSRSPAACSDAARSATLTGGLIMNITYGIMSSQYLR